jgi:hypothetical protein
MSKRTMFVLLLIAGAVAALALYRRRRSAEDLEEWGSFAADTSTARPGMVDAAKDVAKKATEAARGMAAKASSAAEESTG